MYFLIKNFPEQKNIGLGPGTEGLVLQFVERDLVGRKAKRLKREDRHHLVPGLSHIEGDVRLP